MYMNRCSIIIAASVVALASCTVACGNNKAQESEADIEAAMMMGREAARTLVNRKWTDTIELQNYVLEARAKQSELVMAGRPKGAEAFDSAFVTTVKTVNPSLAIKIFPKEKIQK